MKTSFKTNAWGADAQTAREFLRTSEFVLGRALTAKRIETAYLWDVGGHFNAKNTRPDLFIIHLYATGDRATNIMTGPSHLWGCAVGKRTQGEEWQLFEPSGNGLVIIEPKSGYAVAELIGNDLYLLYPATDNELMSARSRNLIFRKVLEEALDLMGGEFPTLAKLVLGPVRKPGKTVINELTRDFAEARSRVEMLVSQNEAAETQLRAMLPEKRFSDVVLERLYSIPEIKTISFRGTEIIFSTHLMYNFHEQRKELREFGEFDMRFLFGSNPRVLFKNTTRRKFVEGQGEFGHPHVDRGNERYWCQGEGEAILPLVSRYEYEASVLFALKAIESVNESSGYQQILSSFPLVKARIEYPKKTAPLTQEAHTAFAKIAGNMKEGRIESLRRDIKTRLESVRKYQGQIILGGLARTIERLSGAAKDTNAVHKTITDQIAQVKTLPFVQSVLIEGDVIIFNLKKVVMTDVSDKSKITVGPLVLRCDFESGIISLRNGSPARDIERGDIHAPQLYDSGDSLPVGQLTLTIPELLGELEFTTAIELVWDFLQIFDGTKVPKGLFARARAAA